MVSETDPVETLLQALREDSEIAGHGSTVSVEVSDDAITLLGDAKHIAAKRRALALTQQHLHNRYRVVDLLRRDVTRRLDDSELANLVAERLSQEPVFAELSLDVEVDGRRSMLHDGGPGAYMVRVSARDEIVTLTGTVGSLTHMRLAEVIAWWTGACAVVINKLSVVPPEEDDDNELTDAILMALEKDPLVDAGQLHVGTAGGIVQVEGLTLTEEQRHSALEDVWLVPGVANVVDRIATPGRGGASNRPA